VPIFKTVGALKAYLGLYRDSVAFHRRMLYTMVEYVENELNGKTAFDVVTFMCVLHVVLLTIQFEL
jgi:hypothetical protein